ncbi:uncharacterized protein LOC141528563 isoform X2 [Cotesia typhae]|uniref:uncharacterized protein LOC141528563 isoform X2 n=1 Tax=Cotesia typhae TaxID=2053667 RepID=UPI003D6843B1
MKTTYSKIKKNNSKRTTGKGRKQWPWVKSMDEIFHNDLSINFGSNVVGSMSSAEENNEVIDLSNPESNSFLKANNTKNNAPDGSKSKASSSNEIHSSADNQGTSPNCYKSARDLKTGTYQLKSQ